VRPESDRCDGLEASQGTPNPDLPPSYNIYVAFVRLPRYATTSPPVNEMANENASVKIGYASVTEKRTNSNRYSASAEHRYMYLRASRIPRTFVPHAITRQFMSFRSQLCRIAVTNAEVHFRKTRRGHAIKPLCFYLPKPGENVFGGRLLGRVKGVKIESLLDRRLGRDRRDRVEGTRRVDRLLVGYHISSHNVTIYVVNTLSSYLRYKFAI